MYKTLAWKSMHLRMGASWRISRVSGRTKKYKWYSSGTVLYAPQPEGRAESALTSLMSSPTQG